MPLPAVPCLPESLRSGDRADLDPLFASTELDHDSRVIERLGRRRGELRGGAHRLRRHNEVEVSPAIRETLLDSRVVVEWPVHDDRPREEPPWHRMVIESVLDQIEPDIVSDDESLVATDVVDQPPLRRALRLVEPLCRRSVVGARPPRRDDK